MITLKACPNCRSKSITQYNQAGFAPHVFYELMPGVKVDAAIITRYFLCQNCHLIFQNPRLADNELDKFYSTGVYRKTLNLTDAEKDRDEEYRAKFDAKLIKEQLGKVKSHLDVGASRGYLLREVGASIKVAVETDFKGIAVKGIKAYSEMKDVPKESFDLVTAIHVLEHVSKPLNFLMEMSGFIGKDGYLIIEVPTWKSPGGPLRLAHLYHFEPDVLKLMCREVGLRVEQVFFTPHLLLICKK